MTYEIGQTIQLTTGEIGEIYGGYDGIYQVWFTGKGMLNIHHTKILKVAADTDTALICVSFN